MARQEDILLLAIRQGGKTSYCGWTGSTSVTFPVSFSTLYGAYSSMLRTGEVGDYRDVQSVSTAKMVVGVDNSARYWLAIGR